jgi:hypothetical protein
MLQHSIEEECTLNDGGKWAEEYYYVTTMRSVETPIPDKNVVRDQGHGGYTLHQYCEMKAARDANLNEADVVVLRLYTGPLFRPWNKALRDKEGLEQWATCIAVLYSAVIKLMKNAPPTTVYRGLDESGGWELPPEFLYAEHGKFAGGIELGFSSTTEDFEVAVKYSGGKENKGTILELEFGIDSRGADIQFLSQYPEEKEWLWPPCTSLTCSKDSIRNDGAKTIVNVRAAVTQKGPDVSRIVKCIDRPTSFQQQQQWPIPKDILNLTSAIGDSIADATRTAKLLEKLRNLARNNAENKERIAAAGGIDRVVQAMAAHVGVAGVQEQGCGALRNLAANAENKKRIAAAGGIDRLVQAKKNHPSCATNADYALRALGASN